jgi:hypothetical protein
MEQPSENMIESMLQNVAHKLRVSLGRKADVLGLLSKMKANLKFGCGLVASAVVELLEQTYFLPIS